MPKKRVIKDFNISYSIQWMLQSVKTHVKFANKFHVLDPSFQKYIHFFHETSFFPSFLKNEY